MMTNFVLFLRSLMFALMFYPVSLFYVVSALIAARIGVRPLRAVVFGWSNAHRLLCRILLGQKTRVIGTLPEGPHFYVFKHESMFETIDMMHLVKEPIVVAKQELLDIPLWGKVAQLHGMIGLKRDTGASALRHLQRQAKVARASNRSILLFPEGTRVPHGQQPPLKAGFAAMYQLLKMPVVPVAVDSGLVSPRRSFLKYPGTVTYKVGEVIPVDLPRDEVEARVHQAINALNPSPAA